MVTDSEGTDLLVIGAGPGGYAAAFHAADLGMKVALVDPEEHPGGVCLYRGCIPSKALLHVASFLHEAERCSEWGISLGEVAVDVHKLQRWRHSVVDNLVRGLSQLADQRGVEYLQGTAALQDPHSATVTLTHGEERAIRFEHAILATGSLPTGLPGAPESEHIMASREALELNDVPSRLLVVGGGYIGVELGQVYASLGAAVTMVEMMTEILPGMDRDLVRFLERRLDGQFESVRTHTRVVSIEDTEDGVRVILEGDAGGEELFDKVMVAVGRQPNTEGLGLEHTRVHITEPGFIEVDDQLRTAEPSILAVGDVTGPPMLAHRAAHQARTAVEVLSGARAAFEPRAFPFVVFSDPEIASCGLTQTEAGERGQEVDVVTFPWAASGRAHTLSRRDGVTKLVCEPGTGRILGAGIAGVGAGEVLAEAMLAIEMGAVAEDLTLTVHTHPTLSETLMEAAQAAVGRSTHHFGRK